MADPLHVLVVDDNQDCADSLALLLRMSAHAAVAAYDTVSALKIAGETSPRLVIVDASMPRANGFELAKQLRALPNTAAAVLVCLTGLGGKKYEQQARDCGFDYFLVKPGDPVEIVRIAQQVVAASSTTD